MCLRILIFFSKWLGNLWKFGAVIVRWLPKQKLLWGLSQIMGAGWSVNCLRYCLNLTPSDNEPALATTCKRDCCVREGFVSGSFGLLSMTKWQKVWSWFCCGLLKMLRKFLFLRAEGLISCCLWMKLTDKWCKLNDFKFSSKIIIKKLVHFFPG